MMNIPRLYKIAFMPGGSVAYRASNFVPEDKRTHKGPPAPAPAPTPAQNNN